MGHKENLPHDSSVPLSQNVDDVNRVAKRVLEGSGEPKSKKSKYAELTDIVTDSDKLGDPLFMRELVGPGDNDYEEYAQPEESEEYEEHVQVDAPDDVGQQEALLDDLPPVPPLPPFPEFKAEYTLKLEDGKEAICATLHVNGKESVVVLPPTPVKIECSPRCYKLRSGMQYMREMEEGADLKYGQLTRPHIFSTMEDAVQAFTGNEFAEVKKTMIKK